MNTCSTVAQDLEVLDSFTNPMKPAVPASVSTKRASCFLRELTVDPGSSYQNICVCLGCDLALKVQQCLFVFVTISVPDSILDQPLICLCVACGGFDSCGVSVPLVVPKVGHNDFRTQNHSLHHQSCRKINPPEEKQFHRKRERLFIWHTHSLWVSVFTGKSFVHDGLVCYGVCAELLAQGTGRGGLVLSMTMTTIMTLTMAW